MNLKAISLGNPKILIQNFQVNKKLSSFDFHEKIFVVRVVT